jgi:hypothetical protein
MKPREPRAQARDLTLIADEIRARIETVGDIIAIGGLLREAKRQLQHGKFLPWVTAEFDFSERTARNYMRAYRFATENAASKSATVADLKLTPSALYFLADRHFSVKDYEQCTADEVALVLNEAAEKRVTRERAEDIILTEKDRKTEQKDDEEALARGLKSGADADAADHAAFLKSLEDEQKPDEPDPLVVIAEEALAATEAATTAAAEADALLDRPSELPPPEPAPQDSPHDKAILATFEGAITALLGVRTKPLSRFKPTCIPAADLQSIVEFLQQVAAAKAV